MSTCAVASCVFPFPIEAVWKVLRDFTFPKDLLSSVISSVEIEENLSSTCVGCVRVMRWHGGGVVRKHRLLELNDQFYVLKWELVFSEPPNEVSAIISKIALSRVSETNQTVVQWSAEFSSDASPVFVNFEQTSYLQNLIEMRTRMTGKKLPILHHLHESPSTRVLWLAAELGIPLEVKESKIDPSPLRRSQSTEFSVHEGGMVASYEEEGLEMLESGAIVMHLLEKYDTLRSLSPTEGTKERANFLKFFFYAASTGDHLLVDAYKSYYVTHSNDETLENNRQQWDNSVALQFEEQLIQYPYIAGDKFTAADVMVGWTMYIANLLGWLDGHPELLKYLNKLHQRPAFQRAFSSRE